MDEKGDVTRLLAAITDGDRAAWDELFPLVYDRLRAIARRQLRGEREGHTFTTTDLVHEAYFSLVGSEGVGWAKSRALPGSRGAGDAPSAHRLRQVARVAEARG